MEREHVRSGKAFDARHGRVYGPTVVDKFLSNGAFRLYMLLCVVANPEQDDSVWHTQRVLGKLIGMSQAEVSKCLTELAGRKLVRMDSGKESGRSNVIYLNDEMDVYGRERCFKFLAEVRETTKEVYASVYTHTGTSTGNTPPGGIPPGGTPVFQPEVPGYSTGRYQKGSGIKNSGINVIQPVSPPAGAGVSPVPAAAASAPETPQSEGVETAAEDRERTGGLKGTAKGGTEAVPRVGEPFKTSVSKAARSEFGPADGRRGPKPVLIPGSPQARLWRRLADLVEKSQWFNGAKLPPPTGKDAGLLKKLAEAFGEAMAGDMIDCMLLDWLGAKAKFRLNGTLPMPGLIWTFRGDLQDAVKRGVGIVTQIHRDSHWALGRCQSPGQRDSGIRTTPDGFALL